MTMIKILTDSTVQLSKEEQERYQITVVPLSVMLENTIFYDGETINKTEFLQKMSESESLPKTSQPAIGRFVETFNEIGNDGSPIIAILAASYLSGTFQAAQQASQLTSADVTVIDSGTVDRALSFQVLKAAELANKGQSAEEILHAIKNIKSNSELYVGIVHLENLIKGGRIGKVMGRVSTMLNMKLMLRVTNTGLELETKGRGLKTLQKKVYALIDHMKTSSVKEIGVTHVGLTPFIEKIIAQLKENFPQADFYIDYASPTLMSHAGKEAFAISYCAV